MPHRAPEHVGTSFAVSPHPPDPVPVPVPVPVPEPELGLGLGWGAGLGAVLGDGSGAGLAVGCGAGLPPWLGCAPRAPATPPATERKALATGGTGSPRTVRVWAVGADPAPAVTK